MSEVRLLPPLPLAARRRHRRRCVGIMARKKIRSRLPGPGPRGIAGAPNGCFASPDDLPVVRAQQRHPVRALLEPRVAIPRPSSWPPGGILLCARPQTEAANKYRQSRMHRRVCVREPNGPLADMASPPNLRAAVGGGSPPDNDKPAVCRERNKNPSVALRIIQESGDHDRRDDPDRLYPV